MPVPSSIADLSTTAASNYPNGATENRSTIDDYHRALSALVRREQAKAANVASASTVNIGAIADGSFVHITGVTTITAFDTVSAGIERVLVFDGALTLTHNATSLILPGGASITTAANDTAVFRSEGSGNWRCISYTRANGTSLVGGSLPTPIDEVHGSDIPSASTLNLTTATGNFVHVTGTTTITAITLADGAERTVVFDGALILTNSSGLLLPGRANITTAAGDTAIFRGDSAGVVRCISYVTAASSVQTFAAGTRIAFQQSSAPTGWTIDVSTINDSIMRVTTAAGYGGTGGSLAFSTWAAQTSVGATTLSTSELPQLSFYTAGTGGTSTYFATTAMNIGNAGSPTLRSSTFTSNGGGSHTHSLSQNIKYYDFVICSKN